jgi:hypothetical protein
MLGSVRRTPCEDLADGDSHSDPGHAITRGPPAVEHESSESLSQLHRHTLRTVVVSHYTKASRALQFDLLAESLPHHEQEAND